MDATTTTDYDAAIQALHSPLHISTSREAIARSSARRKQTISDMAVYMDRLGLSAPPSHPVHILHIAGTKGKGSVACMCERILRHHGYTTGLFTSPHLVELRERIRVKGQLLSRSLWGQAYWHVRRTLEQHADGCSPTDMNENKDLPVLPGYFRMLTLMALYVFTHYRSASSTDGEPERSIDCWIFEVGLGGRYDATQAFHHLWSSSSMSTTPAAVMPRLVCGVTLIDYDHVRVLGHTLEEIAWEKGGIFATGGTDRITPLACYALDTNTDRVLQVLRECCTGSSLRTVGNNNTPRAVSRSLSLGVPGEHQYANAELAVALCRAVVGASLLLDRRIPQALELATWPGRCQRIPYHKDCHLFLDGAHTVESLRSGVQWFGTETRQPQQPSTVLVFYCSHEKNPVDLFRELATVRFDVVLFTKAASERPSGQAVPTVGELLGEQNETTSTEPAECWGKTLCQVWQRLDLQQQEGQVVAWCETVPVTLDRIAHQHSPANVLVTGSLYLVGSVLETVGWKEDEIDGTFSSL